MPERRLTDADVAALADQLARRLRPEALSVRDVAALTSLSERTIWALRARGDFPAGRKRGGRTFWLLSEVRAWLQESPRAS